MICIVVLGAVLAAPAARAEHPAITLLDSDGGIIDPVGGINAHVPFSTKQTCGHCHEYEAITRGYHFQMGWNVISDNHAAAAGRPWSLSDGFMGRWYPYSNRQLAKKRNHHPDEIDLTVYEFVGFSSPGAEQLPCGACHPGGGGLERDRDGKRYDVRLAENPELAQSLDGDYYRSSWDRSGVVEADCLICHLRGYNYDARVDQLTRGNYRWAVVAGSGIGNVSGSVAGDDAPTVRYETRLFNVDGTITLEMSWPPPDANCMFCHGTADEQKRGFTWQDIFNPDVHNQQGVSCAACHPAGLDHQIAKGDEPVSTADPRHDNTMMTCAGCHGVGHLGAPVPEHGSVRPSHLAKLACESCHIPRLHRAAAEGLDATTGHLFFFHKPRAAKTTGDVGEWNPWYQRRSDRRIYPVSPVLAVYWGNRDSDGLVYPLFLRELAAAWPLYSAKVTDDNGDAYPEINREEEIIAGLQAIATTLQGNRRFRRIQPVFLKAETAWELDADGRLVQSPLAGTPLAGATHVDFSLNHSVAPTRMALGASGCTDCHSPEAPFFKGQRVVDPYGPDGEPVTRLSGSFFGSPPWAFAVNSLHQRIITPYVGPTIMLVVFLIVVHYHSYGARRITFVPYSGEIRRFSPLERTVHLLRLIAFVVLAVSGLILAFNLYLWQKLLFGSPQRLHDFHVVSGFVFIVTTAAGIALWLRDIASPPYNEQRSSATSCEPGSPSATPPGRFNAGQRMFYRYSAVLGVVMSFTGVMLVFRNTLSLPVIYVTSTVHNLVGFFLIAGVLAHVYVSTVGNPGEWRVLVDGSVSREWARHHHPTWYDALVSAGVLSPEQDEPAGSTTQKDDDGPARRSAREDSADQA